MSELMIELFSGSKTVAGAFEESGFRTFTLDNNPEFEPDMVADIMEVDSEDLPDRPLAMWISPPCKYFSLANTRGHYFAPGGEPVTIEAIQAVEIVKKALRLVEAKDPLYWFLENPYTGFLRHQKFMERYHMTVVNYCQYGSKSMKPTCIWGEFPAAWNPRTTCQHQRHEESAWGMAFGNSFSEMSFNRAIVPLPLAQELVSAILDSEGQRSHTTLAAFM